MTKRYTIFQKKLEELESLLNSHVFSLAANSQCSQPVLQDIEQRFVFLKNLLSAEIASHPSTPHYLHYIAHRLARLESDFNGWDGRFETSALNHVIDDTALTCSCPESGLNDDGEASDDGDDLGSPVLCEEEDDEPGRLSSGLMVENNALVEFRGDMKHESNQLQDQEFMSDCPVEEKAKEENRVEMESEKEVKGEERRSVGIGSLFGAMAIGVVLGMTLMGFHVMGKFSAGCLHSVEPGSFLIHALNFASISI